MASPAGVAMVMISGLMGSLVKFMAEFYHKFGFKFERAINLALP
ncbi:hypothetical protein [Campylobacter sp. RM16190]|nr:hypothetical protein [Campylobacter sp. RM16190]